MGGGELRYVTKCDVMLCYVLFLIFNVSKYNFYKLINLCLIYLIKLCNYYVRTEVTRLRGISHNIVYSCNCWVGMDRLISCIRICQEKSISMLNFPSL